MSGPLANWRSEQGLQIPREKKNKLSWHLFFLKSNSKEALKKKKVSAAFVHRRSATFVQKSI
jgi:hypothetical protein